MTTPVARSGVWAPGRMARFFPRQLSRLLVLILLTLAAGVGLAGPAAAHNVLTSSDPTDGSTLQSAPTTIRLTFDQPVQDFEPVLKVIGPDGNEYQSGDPVVDSTVVTAGVNALPVAGAYSIVYRIVSADGHPVEGQIKFQLADGAVSGAGASGAEPTASLSAGSSADQSAVVSSNSPVPSAPPATSTSAAVAPVASSSGLSGWVWAAIAVAGILVATAIVVIVRKPAER